MDAQAAQDLLTGTPPTDVAPARPPLVVNAVAHAYNLSAGNARGQLGPMVREGFYGLHAHYNPPGWRMPKELFQTDQSVELLARTHFLESGVDVLAYHVLRLDSLFSDGLCSLAKAVELTHRWPQRVVTYLGIDPTLGAARCVADMEEQFAQLPAAVGVKMYPDQVEPYRTFRMDDEALMGPVYDKALELGLKVVAVHKALPNGPVPLAPYRMDDVDAAAMTHMDLNFEIVHSGMAFVEETAYALARFPNVYANLEITTMLLATAPRLFAEALATFAHWGGTSKVLYGDGSMFTHPQLALHNFSGFQWPDDLADKYGLAPLTDAERIGILGGNYQRMTGLDLDARRAQIDADEFSAATRERGGLLAPFTSWYAEHGKTPPTGTGPLPEVAGVAA